MKVSGKPEIEVDNVDLIPNRSMMGDLHSEMSAVMKKMVGKFKGVDKEIDKYKNRHIRLRDHIEAIKKLKK